MEPIWQLLVLVAIVLLAVWAGRRVFHWRARRARPLARALRQRLSAARRKLVELVAAGGSGITRQECAWHLERVASLIAELRQLQTLAAEVESRSASRRVERLLAGAQSMSAELETARQNFALAEAALSYIRAFNHAVESEPSAETLASLVELRSKVERARAECRQPHVDEKLVELSERLAAAIAELQNEETRRVWQSRWEAKTVQGIVNASMRLQPAS
jgi:hypothetical protein